MRLDCPSSQTILLRRSNYECLCPAISPLLHTVAILIQPRLTAFPANVGLVGGIGITALCIGAGRPMFPMPDLHPEEQKSGTGFELGKGGL